MKRLVFAGPWLTALALCLLTSGCGGGSHGEPDSAPLGPDASHTADANTSAPDAGSTDGGHTGLVLSGAVVPAAQVATSGSLRLHGVVSRDFAGPSSSGGSFTLDHVGFTAWQ